MSARPRVLVVDDRDTIRLALREYLGAHAYEVSEARSVREAEEVAASRRPDVAVLDWELPDGDGAALMARLRAVDPDLPVVILTAHGSIDRAVRAIKEGADEFLTKPVELSALERRLARLAERRREQRALMAHPRVVTEDDPFVGASAVIQRLAEEAARVAASSSPVLITGETGSGKGVLARWLHRASRRRREAFVDLNCAGLSRELAENELFGHERGAFTGAVTEKQGLLEVAHRGTLFLDEIGELDLAVQPKMLTVIEGQRFRRVGDVRERTVDVRLIAASHRDLPLLMESGRFRTDLYFRISPLTLHVPPLRERVEDIVPLARSLLARLADEIGRGFVEISEDAERALSSHPWPGNIRELRNVLERALLISNGKKIGRDALRMELSGQPQRPSETARASATPDGSGVTLADVEDAHIRRVLDAEGGNVTAAARRLGIPRSTLYARLKRAGRHTNSS